MDSDNNKKQLGLIDQVMLAADKGEQFNFDQAKVKLLILCKNKNMMDSSASFLERRGWEVVVTTNMREVFKIITVFRPDLFFVSVNYPNQKIAKLPAVVAQTFRTQVVTFGELNDTKTMQLMQNINANYKMPGSVSGPNIQRRVKQILQEIYNPTTLMATDDEMPEESRPSVGKTKEEAATNKGQGFKIFSSEKKKSGPAFIIAKGADAIPGIDQIGKIAEEFEAAEVVENIESAANDEADADALAAKKEEKQNAQSFANDTAALAGDNKFNLTKNKTNEQAHAGPSFNISNSDAHSSVETDELLQAVAEISEKSSLRGSSVASDTNNSSSEAPQQAEATAPAAMYEGGQSLERIIKDAAIAATSKKIPNYEPIRTTTEALIVPIDFDGSMGVILLALSGTAKDRVLFEQKFIGNLRSVRGKQKIFVGKTQRMYFEEAEVRLPTDVSAISFKVPNASGEACITYVENERATVRIKRLPSGKSEVSIQDLAEECVVGADVFLHLPQNNKFYKVVSSNGWISKKQKERLAVANAAIFIDTSREDEFIKAQSKAKAIAAARAQWRPVKKTG